MASKTIGKLREESFKFLTLSWGTGTFCEVDFVSGIIGSFSFSVDIRAAYLLRGVGLGSAMTFQGENRGCEEKIWAFEEATRVKTITFGGIFGEIVVFIFEDGFGKLA